MADVVLSSCCYNLVYSATSWGFSTTPGTVYSVTVGGGGGVGGSGGNSSFGSFTASGGGNSGKA